MIFYIRPALIDCFISRQILVKYSCVVSFIVYLNVVSSYIVYLNVQYVVRLVRVNIHVIKSVQGE